MQSFLIAIVLLPASFPPSFFQPLSTRTYAIQFSVGFFLPRVPPEDRPLTGMCMSSLGLIVIAAHVVLFNF